MVCWSEGEHTICKPTLVLNWSKSIPTLHYKTNNSFLIPNNRITHILIPVFASIIILQRFLESLYCWNPYTKRKHRQGIYITLPNFSTTWWSVESLCMLMLLKIIQGKVKIWSVKASVVCVSNNSRKLRGWEVLSSRTNSIPQRKIFRSDEDFVPFIPPFENDNLLLSPRVISQTTVNYLLQHCCCLL